MAVVPAIHQYLPSVGWTLNGRPMCLQSLVDVKNPMVSFVKSRRAIAGTMAKFQILPLTTATLSANDATPQSGAVYERTQQIISMQKETMGSAQPTCDIPTPLSPSLRQVPTSNLSWDIRHKQTVPMGIASQIPGILTISPFRDLSVLVFFRLLPLGVATADHPL